MGSGRWESDGWQKALDLPREGDGRYGRSMDFWYADKGFGCSGLRVT
jgi:hypothetical protein